MLAVMADVRMSGSESALIRHVRSCANLLAVQLLISSHARLPVSWDISGCVLLSVLVDTFVREVSHDLPAT